MEGLEKHQLVLAVVLSLASYKVSTLESRVNLKTLIIESSSVLHTNTAQSISPVLQMAPHSSLSPATESAESWKRKYEMLEVQYATTKDLQSESNAKMYVHSHELSLVWLLSFSITDGQVTLGCGMRRLVDMFHTARDLVEESERRIDLAAIEDDREFTEE